MPYKFFAFISYRHTDVKMAKQLQFLLESYSFPTAVQKNNPQLPKKFKIFRDRDELTTGELNEAIHKKLEESKYLIVICSPQSAQSKYVGDEISYFRKLGREKQIIPFIVSGTPHSPTNDCFHPELTRGGLELLGIDIQTENLPFARLRFHKAFIRLVAAMLELDFGQLWNRRKIFLFKLATTFVLLFAIVVILAFTAFKAQPFDAAIKLDTPNKQLPLSKTNTDSLYLYLSKGDVRTMPVNSLDSTIIFPNLPGKYEGQSIRLCCKAHGFEKMDTLITLNHQIVLPLVRKVETYGQVRYQILDNETDAPLSQVVFDFGFLKATSDEDGILNVIIPLEHQNEAYKVKITLHGEKLHLTYSEQGDSISALISEELPVLYVKK